MGSRFEVLFLVIKKKNNLTLGETLLSMYKTLQLQLQCSCFFYIDIDQYMIIIIIKSEKKTTLPMMIRMMINSLMQLL